MDAVAFVTALLQAMKVQGIETRDERLCNLVVRICSLLREGDETLPQPNQYQAWLLDMLGREAWEESFGWSDPDYSV